MTWYEVLRTSLFQAKATDQTGCCFGAIFRLHTGKRERKRNNKGSSEKTPYLDTHIKAGALKNLPHFTHTWAFSGITCYFLFTVTYTQRGSKHIVLVKMSTDTPYPTLLIIVMHSRAWPACSIPINTQLLEWTRDGESTHKSSKPSASTWLLVILTNFSLMTIGAATR